MAKWKTDGWKYTDERSGVHETRHDAVGAAAIKTREYRERRSIEAPDLGAGPTVKEGTSRVYAFKPFLCSACGGTFLTEDEYEEHRPCPHERCRVCREKRIVGPGGVCDGCLEGVEEADTA